MVTAIISIMAGTPVMAFAVEEAEDVLSNTPLIMTPDLLTGTTSQEEIRVTTADGKPVKPDPKPLTTEQKANKLLNSEWKTYNSTQCKMTVDYPVNFTIAEKQNRFDTLLPFQMHYNDPFISLLVNCEENFPLNPDVDERDMNQIKNELIGFDEFLVEDTNMTKWRLGNLTTGSFVFGNTDIDGNPNTGNEVLYTYRDGKDMLISFVANALEFDLPDIHQIEQRMINSITFFD
jgi:hypothetical protein